MNLRNLYSPLLSIAEEASKAILDIYNDPERFNVQLKNDDSPLTAADQASNEIICAGLQDINGDIPIISEENKQIPFEERSAYEYCWMVDPLDGTKEFVKRNGEFTINIALIKDSRAVLGLMHIPVAGASFYASMGDGAYKVHDGETSAIKCRPFDSQAKSLGMVCSRSHPNDRTLHYVEKYIDPILVPRGSALKFTAIAQGEADIYPRLGPTMEWDTAAAQIILESAGGQVLDFETRLPLRYNKENLLNPNFIAFGLGSLIDEKYVNS